MKIAILSQSYPPMISGAAIFAGRLARALAASGHTVLVLAASEAEHAYREQHDRLTVIRMASVPNPFRVGQRALLWPRAEVFAALQSFAPDVLHVHDAFQLALWGSEYARRTGRACAATLHGLPSLVTAFVPPRLRGLVETGLWRYAAWLLRRFDAVIAPTRITADVFRARTGIAAAVISCGLDLKTFHPAPLSNRHEARLRADLGLPAASPIILHAGRLDPEKDVQSVVRAAARAMRASRAHLLVVGDGKDRPALERLCRTLGIGERAHFTGYVQDRGRLAEMYRLADLFVTGSCIETQGLVLLEAAACGLPIVAADCSAVPEIVVDGVNGYLMPPGQPQAMAARMLEILRDASLAARLRRASRRASLPHDFARSVAAHERFYGTLSGRRVLTGLAAAQNAEGTE
jgi:glycosyltransferase involved in cell wall biosynthesis